MPEPEVIDQPEVDRTEHDPITKLADGRWCATVDPGDGSPVTRFYGATREKVIGQLIHAQANATKKLREQKRLLKTGQVQVDAAQPTVEFKPKSLSADDQWRIAADLQDPSKAASAVKKLIEAEFGAPVEHVRATLSQAQQQTARVKMQEEGKLFLDEHPDYQNTTENERLLVEYLKSHGMAYTAHNLAVAYEDLSSSNLLQTSYTPTVEPTPTPASGQTREPEDTRVTVRPRSAQTGIPARTSTPRPAGNQVRLTAEEIDRMSPEEYGQRLRDPQFVAAVEKLAAARSSR